MQHIQKGTFSYKGGANGNVAIVWLQNTKNDIQKINAGFS